jgi:phosphoglycolate phosphatase-like HAD superfamily hydrolase
MIRNIIWDADGTLFDTFPAFASAFSAALEDLGSEASLEWIDHLARSSLDHCVETLAAENNLDVDMVRSGFRRHYANISPLEQPPFPGVIEVCELICSIDGINVVVTHRGTQSLQRLLNAHSMTHLFTAYLTGDDPFPRKPDPAMFEEMIERYDLNRADTLAVGDRVPDVQSGKAVRIRTVYFGTGSLDTQADISINDYAELRRLIVHENRLECG